MAQLQRHSFKSSRFDWDAVQASSRGILQCSPSLNHIKHLQKPFGTESILCATESWIPPIFVSTSHASLSYSPQLECKCLLPLEALLSASRLPQFRLLYLQP